MRSTIQHIPGKTAQDAVRDRRACLATSPFHRDTPRPQPLDRSQIVACPADGCYKRFISADFLAQHQELDHGPRPVRVKTTAQSRESAALLQRIVDTITDRIADGSYKPGTILSQAALSDELGVTRHFTTQGIEQLIAAGALQWSNATSAYGRRPMVPPEVTPARSLTVIRAG